MKKADGCPLFILVGKINSAGPDEMLQNAV